MNGEGMRPRLEDERLLRYLLGEATEDERSSVEREFLADDERYQELEALEDELRHDYLRGALSPTVKGRFEARLLASPADREKLERARDVLAALDRAGAEPLGSRKGRTASPWLAAAAVVCLGAGTWAIVEAWRARARIDELAAGRGAAEAEWARRLADEKGRAEILARDLRAAQDRRASLEEELGRRDAVASPTQSVIPLLLSPGLVRGAEVPTAALAPAPSLRLTLRLPSGEAGARYRAVLRRVDGTPLWSRGGLARRDSASGPFVVLTVPAEGIGEGEYEVALSRDAATHAEEVADYHFAVARRR